MKARMLMLGLFLAGALACAPLAQAATSHVQAKVTAALSGDMAMQGVRATASDGVVTLEGTVPLYADKVKAEKKARKAAEGLTVRDLVEVAGPKVPDAVLARTVARSLAYEPFAHSNLFNAISVNVRNGVVALNGTVISSDDEHTYVDAVAHTPGVKGVLDAIQVAPASNFDDALRVRLARAIYGDSVLSKYALDPAAPIRIVVVDGHITLYGTVDSKMDRQIAGMRANEVFGGFSVDNRLTTPADRVR